nr:putative uncharacterized protein ENSP00000383309 [Macaca fascicularis]
MGPGEEKLRKGRKYVLRKEEKCVGDSLRVPAGGRCSCARDSQQWPLRVTATDKQVSLRHNPSLPPSLPGSVTHRASLFAHPSTPSLTPAGRGRPAHAAAPAASPRGEPEEEGDKCHLLRPREELLKSSQATGSKGNSPADARPRRLAARAQALLCPHSRRARGAVTSLGVTAAGGGGEQKTCDSRWPDPRPPTPAAARRQSRAAPAPAPAQGAEERTAGGRSGSATRAERPLPKVPSCRAQGPSALTCNPDARGGKRRDPRPGGGRPQRRDSVRSARQPSVQPPLALRVRQRRRRRETGCAQPRPPLRPPRQWKTPGLTALTHAGPPARPPGSPAPEAPPPPPPGAWRSGLGASLRTLTRRRRLRRSPPPALSRQSPPRPASSTVPKGADDSSWQSRE